jgi:D-beta-D-heptose 7-phosphate kinase/D-beta-D-heptose 1-phosphate adenosyltransferase
MLDLTLPSLKNTHVIVVGDLMVDRYWYGDALRISQEAPVPVVHVNEVEDRPGGAANVALNIVALGAKATLIGVVGDDDTGRDLKNTLEAAGVVCDFLISPDYPTTTKLRVMSQKQQLIRTDFETLPDKSVDDALAVKLGQAIAADCEQVIILEDYDKGSITDPQVFLKVANEKNVSVVVDPKNKAISEYAGAAIVKPNLHEFLALSGAVDSDEELVEKARLVVGDHNIAALVVTRGGASRMMTRNSESRKTGLSWVMGSIA